MKKVPSIFLFILLSVVGYCQTVTNVTKAPQPLKIMNEAYTLPYDETSINPDLKYMKVYKRSAVPVSGTHGMISYQQYINVTAINLTNTSSCVPATYWSNSSTIGANKTFSMPVTVQFTTGATTYIASSSSVEIVSAYTKNPAAYSQTDPRRCVFLKEGSYAAKDELLGTLTMTSTVDGVTYTSQTVKLICAEYYAPPFGGGTRP